MWSRKRVEVRRTSHYLFSSFIQIVHIIHVFFTSQQLTHHHVLYPMSPNVTSDTHNERLQYYYLYTFSYLTEGILCNGNKCNSNVCFCVCGYGCLLYVFVCDIFTHANTHTHTHSYTHTTQHTHTLTHTHTHGYRPAQIRTHTDTPTDCPI